eukprot:TRINITY_DN62724_c0_g1_i1.p1 TRINITY_DN62724_c0_g1~~TRINITY_DN62724_c0_g1_i1.p1  ORF type:complete len:558 (-),score=125.39 TRINITY_DN62724_c0_g1_i1:168-1763(-)
MTAVTAAGDEDLRTDFGSEGEIGPMQMFVQQHLVGILSPLAEHIREMQQQVQSIRDEFLGKSVEIGKNSVQVKEHGELLLALKREMDQVNAAAAKSQFDNSKMIEVMSKGHVDRLQGLQVQFDQEYFAMRTRIDELEASSKDYRVRTDALEKSCEVLGTTLSERTAQLQTLEESSERNHHCWLGLSDRLEATRHHAEEMSQELQRLKLQVANFQNEAVDSRTRTNRRLDQLQTQLTEHLEEMKAVQERLVTSEKGLHKMMDEFASMEANMVPGEDSKGNKEEEGEDKKGHSALERFGKRLVKMRDELTTLGQQLHDRAMGELQNVVATVENNSASIGHNASAIKGLEGKLNELRQHLDRETAAVAEQGRLQVALLGGRTHAAEADLRQLSSDQQAISAMLDVRRVEMEEMCAAYQTTNGQVQGLRSDVNGLSSQLGAAEQEMSSMERRLDLAHDFLQGFGKGLQVTHQQVLDGKSGMLPYKEALRPKVLPALPQSPVPLSARRPHTSCSRAQEAASDAGSPPPHRPATSLA